jgi:hypothetical protein
MFAGVGIAFMRDLAAVNSILQHEIERSTGHFLIAICVSIGVDSWLAANPCTGEFIL